MEPLAHAGAGWYSELYSTSATLSETAMRAADLIVTWLSPTGRAELSIAYDSGPALFGDVGIRALPSAGEISFAMCGQFMLRTPPLLRRLGVLWQQ